LPTDAAEPTRGRRGWMLRRSKTSRTMGESGGSGNWRKHSERKAIDRKAVRRVYIPKPNGKLSVIGRREINRGIMPLGHQ
jgi:hypothetical protein